MNFEPRKSWERSAERYAWGRSEEFGEIHDNSERELAAGRASGREMCRPAREGRCSAYAWFTSRVSGDTLRGSIAGEPRS